MDKEITQQDIDKLKEEILALEVEVLKREHQLQLSIEYHGLMQTRERLQERLVELNA